MNPLIKKEIRLLLPSFLIGVALACINVCFKQDDQFGSNTLIAIVSIVACAGVAVFTALNSFGAEISSGTFSMLLAQPVSRERIWQTKTRLLAAALFIGGFIWCAVLFARFQLFSHPKGLGDFWEIFLGTWVFLAVVYSGALWTVLLLRQMAAAFWFTLLTPGVIMIGISGLWPEKYYDACEVAVALLIYSWVGIRYARRLFLRAQDVAWTGGNIVWPEIRRAAGTSRRATEKRCRRPRAALFWKEVQLHQSGFVLAGALVLLHLGVLVARKFGRFQMNSSMEFILEIFWGLWLVMPMLVGAAAVAEERKLGTLAGQLCLPVKRRTQFVVKLCIVLLLSVLFGVVMPMLLEGQRICPGGQLFPDGFDFGYDRWELTEQPYFWICLGVINSLKPLLLFLGIATGIGAISFYASTLARNTLQTLAPAVLGIIVFAMLLFNASRPEWFFGYPFWCGPLIYLIGVPVFVLALVALAFGNSQRLDFGWSVWRRNAVGLVAVLAFIIVATTTIYHRAWEKLTPIEPAHGAAQLTQANPASLSEEWNALFVRLPDGRIWVDEYWWTYGNSPLAMLLNNIRMASQGRGGFYAGSNWVSVVRGVWREQVGLKTDGTLWLAEIPRHSRMARNWWGQAPPENLVRIGSETNWSSVANHNMNMILVKTDGTLWCWGTNNINPDRRKWPGLQAFTPYRLGTESNWAEVSMNYRCQLRKRDGSLWDAWTDQPGGQQTNELEPGFTIQRAQYLEPGKWRSTTEIWSGLSYKFGIRDDGTFRIRADQRLRQRSGRGYGNYEWTAMDLQFGQDTNWLAVAGNRREIVTLKNDGTLWLWPFHFDNRQDWDHDHYERKMLEQKPVRLGTYADWIAITSAEGGVFSLAADGSLWHWPLDNDNSYNNETGLVRLFQNNHDNSIEPLLDYSRKPQLLGNIFGKSD